jgi:hypothetical protein
LTRAFYQLMVWELGRPLSDTAVDLASHDERVRGSVPEDPEPALTEGHGG